MLGGMFRWILLSRRLWVNNTFYCATQFHFVRLSVHPNKHHTNEMLIDRAQISSRHAFVRSQPLAFQQASQKRIERRRELIT